MRAIPSIGTPEGGGVGQGQNRGSAHSALCGVFGLSLVPCYGARIFRRRTDCLIKVDREERPDIDETCMSAVQAMTGQGGWPMTVFLTPDLRPFFGGTYFPPEDRHGRPGFPKLLQAIAEFFRQDRDGVRARLPN